METKKRLKLVRNSGRKLYAMGSNMKSLDSEKNTGCNDFVQDDIDAEGDADEEADVEMQVKT